MDLKTGQVYPSLDAALAARVERRDLLMVDQSARLARMAKERSEPARRPRRKPRTKNQLKSDRQKLRSWGKGTKKRKGARLSLARAAG